jgi:LytR cell envelope-related transcriptional attenuator
MAGSSAGSGAGTSGAVDRSAPLRVLNGTRRAGLATRAAATLRSAGWVISSLGNTDGGDGPATTTVYYSGGGLLATARAVSHDLPGSQRVMRSERFGAPAVTVVLGADYAG